MNKRRRQPWPSDAAIEYHRLWLYREQAAKRLKIIKHQGLNGEQNIHLTQVLLPQVEAILHHAKDAILDYEARKNPNTARWSNQAISDIDFIIGGMVKSIKKAQQSLCASSPNLHLIEVIVEQSLAKCAEILTHLKQGPPPEGNENDMTIWEKELDDVALD